MKKALLSFLMGISGLMGICLYAQIPVYDASLIADSLKQGTLSVIRCNDITFTQTSENTGICQHHLVITILSDAGHDHSAWSTYTDSYIQLSDFEGKIYDASGKQLKKIKQKDLSLNGYSEHLKTDARSYYYVPDKQANYPFTIEYIWEEKFKNGIYGYLNQSPINSYRQSSEECKYEIIIPSGNIITLARNTSAQWLRSDEGNQVRYSFTMPPSRGFQQEDMLPRNILPEVNASPINFSRDGYKGQLDSWEHLGDWAIQLWKGRQELPTAELDTIQRLTAQLDNERDKIEALYKYLARKTRYVSIQLGIGGWQPMMASEVSRMGFGDCKALSNYMHSMLRQAGIESFPVIIGTRHKRYIPDYPNFFQNNHCILCVPQATDSLWIECTAAADIPFGTIASSLLDHDCILLTPEGAKLDRVPNSIPQCITSAHINIGSDLKAECSAVETDYKGHEEKIKKQYGKVLGGRTQLFPLDPYTDIYIPQFRKNSPFPMERSSALCFIDTLHFHLAENVYLESVPDLTDASTINNRLTLEEGTPMHWSGEGMLDSWQVEISKEENGICVVVTLTRQSGSRPASDKDAFIIQCKQFSDILNAKLIFKKK